jgi:PEGA domain
MMTVILAATLGASPWIVVDAALPVSEQALIEEFPGSHVTRTARPISPSVEDPKLALKRAEESCRSGRQEALAMRTVPAIAKYELALASFLRGAAAIEHFDVMAHCLIDLGDAWIVEGKPDRAAVAFKRALSLSPGTSPNAKDYNPEVTKRFAALRNELARAAPSALTITGEPQGASIQIDGVNKGLLPLSLGGLPAGEHVLVVRAPGYQTFVEILTVTPGSGLRREVFLAPLESRREARLLDLDAMSAEDSKRALAGFTGTGVVISRAWTARAQNADGVLSAELRADDFRALAAQVKKWWTPVVAPAATQTSPATQIIETPRAVHPAIAILPFGVGQLVEKRPVAGALFLASEVALLATNIATAAFVIRQRNADGLSPNVERDATLRIVNLTSFGLLIAMIIGGGVDGFVHRQDPP